MRQFKIVAGTTSAVILIVCLFVGIDLAFAVAMVTTGYFLQLPWMGEISILWLILAFWVLPKDWLAINRRYTCKGSAVIAAPLGEVWEELRLRPRGSSYRPTVTRITADLTIPTRYKFHFDERLSEDKVPQRIMVDVAEEQPQSYMRLEYPHPLSLPSSAKDVICSEVFLEQTDHGVKVTFAETLRRLTITTLFTLMFVNPCKDSAHQLKSWIEGSEDRSWLGVFMKGVGEDGTPAPEVRSGALIAGVTAVVVASVIAVAIGTFIMSALPAA